MPIRLSGRDIVKALGKDGWELQRVTGSHHGTRSGSTILGRCRAPRKR
jgi:predicted RNA binding protein YcfA (HicA-like mRNA interferase family)